MEKYLSNYRFKVMIGTVPGLNSQPVSFARASGLEMGLDYEDLQEGGINESTHVLTVPAKKNGTLVLERGVAGQKSWVNQLKPGMYLGTWLRVALTDAKDSKKILRAYEITGGVVTKWELSPLDALGHDVLIEKLEIQYTGLKIS